MAFVNKHQHTFELIQQTPILHYQGKEAGATVRASEMKPKLDRFILDLYPDEVQEDWIRKMADDKEEKLPSLAYKMNVFSAGKSTPWDKRKDYSERPQKVPGGYFGGLKSDSAIVNRTTEVVITCYIDELMETIKEAFPLFLAVTNFGSRQRMGYGSFALKSPKWNRKALLCEYAMRKNKEKENVLCYAFELPGNVTGRDTGLSLDIVKDFHQHLKSGVRTGNYDANCSIMLKKYPANQKDQSVNEKKAFKAALAKSGAYKLGPLTMEHDDKAAEEALKKVYLGAVVYKRGIFGFAGNYEFRGIIRKGEKRKLEVPKCTVSFSLKVKNTKSGVEIKRFPSPITYFVDGNQILFLVRADHIARILEEEPNIMFSQNESVSVWGKKRVEKGRGAAKPVYAHLPQEFDVKEFFGFVAGIKVPCCVKVGKQPIGGFYKLNRVFPE